MNSKIALVAVATLVTSLTAVLPATAMVLPAPKPHNQTTTVNCSEQFGYMPRVFAADIAAVDDGDHVWVTEVCSGDDMMRSEGNAGAIRGAIADNDVLVAALDDKAFTADDVFAVRKMGNGTINLYVHHFGR